MNATLPLSVAKQEFFFTSFLVSFAFCRTLVRTLAAWETQVGRQDGVGRTSLVVRRLDGVAKEPQPGQEQEAYEEEQVLLHASLWLPGGDKEVGRGGEDHSNPDG